MTETPPGGDKIDTVDNIVSVDDYLTDYFTALQQGRVDSFAALLPLFMIGEDHMSTELHYQLTPFFRLEQPMSTVYMCSRQVGKSMGVSAQTILRGHFYKGFHTLIIEPRADQLARFNGTILRPLLKNCLIRDRIIDAVNLGKFFVKELKSGSIIYLEYCFQSPDRARGISGASSVVFDEAQDIEYEHLPAVIETMSASRRFGFQQYTGTPKTTDGTLGVLWEDSSQAEWIIPCQHCSKKNIPALGHDILKMLGRDTVVCAKCGKPLDGRLGAYVHARPELASSHAGYHFSQITHPLHYGIKTKWQMLRGKMEGPGAYSQAKFYNEVLGVPCDESVKLLSQADLIKASTKHPNDYDKTLSLRNRYAGYVMGVDWSGGGDLSDSYTAISVVGFRNGTDVVDCLYAERIPPGLSPEEEASHIMERFRALQCAYLAHDYGGAGYIRESLLRQAGLADHQIVPYTYVNQSSKDVIVYNPPTGAGTRFSYSIDKARSLAVMCAMVRALKITLPAYDDQSRLVLDDLLNLVEMPREMPRGGTMYLIGKAAKKSDDFAHALNYACSAIWYTRQAYPNLSDMVQKFRMSETQLALAAASDPSKLDWR